MLLTRLVAIVAVSIIATFAIAHDLRLSGIHLSLSPKAGKVEVLVHISRLQARESGGRRLTNLEIDWAVRRRLQLQVDGGQFRAAQSIVTEEPQSDLIRWTASFARQGKDLQILGKLFPEDPTSKTIVVVSEKGKPSQQFVLDALHRSWKFSQTPTQSQPVVFKYLGMGIEHILSGLDHILFVAGLIMLGSRFRSLIKIVTAFTIAHSLTLSLAVLRLVNPPAAIVEPLIALSIVAIAVENLRSRQERQSGRDYRPLVAFGFGLVHGFGFAGALTNVGLDGFSLAAALASFNLGVELGQALIIGVSLPIIGWFGRKQPTGWSRFAFAGSIAIGLVGSFWFFERIST